MVSSWRCSLEAIPEQIPEILIRNNSWKASGLPSDLAYFQETSEPSASYKKQIGFLALSAKDDIEFQRASNKQLQGLGVHFQDLVPVHASQGWDWLLPQWTLEEWKFAQVWVFLRLTGGPRLGRGEVATLLFCLVIQLCWNPWRFLIFLGVRFSSIYLQKFPCVL